MQIKIGEKISPSLSEALKAGINVCDYERIANKHNKSWKSIRQIVYRACPVTRFNEPALIDLTRTAIKNLNKHNKTLTNYV